MSKVRQLASVKRLALLGGVLWMVLGGLALAQTKITFWTWVDLAPAIEQFEASHPDIDVELVQLGPWDLHDKLLTVLSAGSGAPDVAMLVIRRLDAYLDTGLLTNLTPYLSEEYVSQVQDTFLSSVTKDGNIFGLPTDYGPGVIWYRRDIFAEHGIETPIETWDDFIEAGKKIREETNGEQYMMPLFIPSGQWGVASFVQYLHSRGGNFYTEDGTLIRDNELLKDTLQWYYDLVNKHDIAYPVPFYTPSFWALLEAGKFATLAANTAEGRNIQKFAAGQEGDWGVMPWPKWSADAPARTGVWGGNVLVVPEQSAHKEAAVTFAKWLTSTVEGQVAFFEAVGGIPIYEPALATDRLQQPEPFFGGDVIASKVNPVTTWYWFDEAETTTIFGQLLDQLFADQISVEEVITRFEDEVNRRLNR